MWDLPRPGFEPVSLAGGFFTTESPGKPLQCINCLKYSLSPSAVSIPIWKVYFPILWHQTCLCLLLWPVECEQKLYKPYLSTSFLSSMVPLSLSSAIKVACPRGCSGSPIQRFGDCYHNITQWKLTNTRTFGKKSWANSRICYWVFSQGLENFLSVFIYHESQFI